MLESKFEVSEVKVLAHKMATLKRYLVFSFCLSVTSIYVDF